MLTHQERSIGRILQRDIPLAERPYLDIAARTGLTEQDVLRAVKRMLRKGLIRKIGAIVRHREAGFSTNAMVVWAAPEDLREQVGLMLSSFPDVTHCYERTPEFEGKYNIFSMIHVRGTDIHERIEAISIAIGVSDYQVLISEEELKKTSMEYFV